MWLDFLAELSPEVNQNGGEFRFGTKTMAPYEIASKAGFDFRMITYRILYTDSYSGFQGTRRSKDFVGFEIFYSRIFRARKIWQVFFWMARFM